MSKVRTVPKEKDTAFRTVQATMNHIVWERMRAQHDMLNHADTVTGVLYVGRHWSRSGYDNEEAEMWIDAKRNWRKICEARGRPYITATTGYLNHFELSCPKKTVHQESDGVVADCKHR